MLDDYTGGNTETFHAFPCGICIGNIVVAELFALQLSGCDKRARRGIHVAVKRSLLVRVFPITQVLQLDKAAIRLRWKLRMAAISLNAAEVVADGPVILADAIKRGD